MTNLARLDVSGEKKIFSVPRIRMSGCSGDSDSSTGGTGPGYQREMSMEEGTLQLAQSLARQSLDEEESAEALDGSPQPLRKNPNTAGRLEGKLQGFRSVEGFGGSKIIRQIFVAEVIMLVFQLGHFLAPIFFFGETVAQVFFFRRYLNCNFIHLNIVRPCCPHTFILPPPLIFLILIFAAT